MIVNHTKYKTLIITNSENNLYRIVTDMGWETCSLDDKQIEDKIAAANYVLFEQYLLSKETSTPLNTYVFIQALIEQDYNMNSIGIFTFNHPIRLEDNKLQILQSILRPYQLPIDQKTWVKHLNNAKTHTCNFSLVKKRYKKEIKALENKKPIKILEAVLNKIQSITAFF